MVWLHYKASLKNSKLLFPASKKSIGFRRSSSSRLELKFDGFEINLCRCFMSGFSVVFLCNKFSSSLSSCWTLRHLKQSQTILSFVLRVPPIQQQQHQLRDVNYPLNVYSCLEQNNTPSNEVDLKRRICIVVDELIMPSKVIGCCCWWFAVVVVVAQL